MAKIYLEKNVLEAAYERLSYVFEHSDNVCFSVSGGKDSSVMVQIANKLNKPYDILYIDFEAQYQATIEHMDELKLLSNVRNIYHVALPISLRNAVSILQPKWICWEKNKEDLWVRQLPENAITEENNIFDFYRYAMEFEEFVPAFAKWYQRKCGGTVFFGIGIRSDESLNRFRTIAMMENKVTFNDKVWTTLVSDQCYNFYPIYDWTTEDIWGAVSQNDLLFNLIYEQMYKNGLSIHEARLCQPYGDDQRNGLDQFRSLEYETWEKVLHRVNGVNFGNIYARTSALGNIRSVKPDSMNWQQYSVFLLESIGLYNHDLMIHYVDKIRKFIKWYREVENIDLRDIPDEADAHEEALRKTISWRRIARAIEKNDFYMKRLSFSQTKSDTERLIELSKKWSNLLSSDMVTTDKDLREFKEKFYEN